MDNQSKLTNILKKYSNYILLVALITIVSLITYYRVLIQIEMGPLSDSCDFLSNALVFAGQNMSYFDSTRPPFFSFLLSLIFRMGYVSTNAIFILDGLMYIFGVVGLFFLLKLRFNGLQSFLGALLYATFSIVLAVMSVGFSDLASVSITIWTFYFLILAVKKDSKFFYLVFPLAMLAFLTRVTNALIVFPIFLYILINRTEIKKFKNLVIGMFASVLFLIPVFIFFYEKFSNPLYPFMSAFGATSAPRLAESAAYDSNLFFFIDKFPSFIGLEGMLTILIILVGFLIYWVLKIKQKSGLKKGSLNGLNFENRVTKLKLVLFTVLILIFILSFGQILSYFSEVLFFISIYLLYDIAKNLNIKYLDMHMLFLAWFMVFFIFHSSYATKDNRYFVVMAPAIAYFLILGLSEISSRLKFKIKKHDVTFPIIAIILTIIILLSTASYLPVIREANNDNKLISEHIVLVSEWFITYDPDYKNKVIYSDLWPYFSWYLKTNVKPMPIFKDNQKYYGGVKEFSLTPQDNMAYNKELDDNNVDYYFCIRQGLNLTSYEPVKQFGKLIIYKKK